MAALPHTPARACARIRASAPGWANAIGLGLGSPNPGSIRAGKPLACIFQLILEPEDVQVCFVSLHHLQISEWGSALFPFSNADN
jgi:hypothetical protein